jgi:hypothetical protein
LIAARRGKPKQAFLRRAVSSTYYAMFHTLARSCADCLIGGGNADRSAEAWHQVYRSLDHGFARNQCKDNRVGLFPQAIQDFANLFSAMQFKRHKADYDPFERFVKSSVSLDVEQVRIVIAAFKASPLKDRRAFSAFILFRMRKD